MQSTLGELELKDMSRQKQTLVRGQTKRQREMSIVTYTFTAPGEAPGRESHSINICLNKFAIYL